LYAKSVRPFLPGFGLRPELEDGEEEHAATSRDKLATAPTNAVRDQLRRTDRSDINFT
jgi:hypothetical protein